MRLPAPLLCSALLISALLCLPALLYFAAVRSLLSFPSLHLLIVLVMRMQHEGYDWILPGYVEVCAGSKPQVDN